MNPGFWTFRPNFFSCGKLLLWQAIVIINRFRTGISDFQIRPSSKLSFSAKFFSNIPIFLENALWILVFELFDLIVLLWQAILFIYQIPGRHFGFSNLSRRGVYFSVWVGETNDYKTKHKQGKVKGKGKGKWKEGNRWSLIFKIHRGGGVAQGLHCIESLHVYVHIKWLNTGLFLVGSGFFLEWLRLLFFFSSGSSPKI